MRLQVKSAQHAIRRQWAGSQIYFTLPTVFGCIFPTATTKEGGVSMLFVISNATSFQMLIAKCDRIYISEDKGANGLWRIRRGHWLERYQTNTRFWQRWRITPGIGRGKKVEVNKEKKNVKEKGRMDDEKRGRERKAMGTCNHRVLEIDCRHFVMVTACTNRQLFIGLSNNVISPPPSPRPTFYRSKINPIMVR